jgi:heme-degrading monooxygenase HmoA
MHARVTRIQSPVDRIEDGIALINSQIIPTAKGLEGFAGAYFLGDRQTGKIMSVVLWDSEEHMQSSEEAAERLRGDAATQTQGTVESVERYEVLTQA